MNKSAEKSESNKNQTESKKTVQKQNTQSATLSFLDARPDLVQQKKLQTLADGGAQPKSMVQLQAMADQHAVPHAVNHNNKTKDGLPENLKNGIESLSNLSMDGVKVHYNSAKPAQLQAHAYAQGTDIHVASGQEKHLPHEAWHVVQQKQNRVKPTGNIGKATINDDKGLETEADVMGAKALSTGNTIAQKKDLVQDNNHNKNVFTSETSHSETMASSSTQIAQRAIKPVVQKKRERDKEGEDPAVSQQKSMQLHPIQRQSKVIQMAIESKEEAPPGTRIMVVNPAAKDTGDLGTVIRLSNSKANCMAVEFDNEKGVEYRVYFNEINVVSKPDAPLEEQLPEEEQLKAMIDAAITAAKGAEQALNAVMSTDETYAHDEIKLPAAQLNKCLEDCQGLSAEKTAEYMYTTYFYGPLNRYLRNPEVKLDSAAIQKLVDIVHAFLTRAFNNTQAAQAVTKYRMELKAEWIDNAAPNAAAEVGDALGFKAFTSTHPELAGVNGMWGNIESGAFGEVTKLALLVFQGNSKFLYPSAKYFPNEHENILPPDTNTKIIKQYPIEWIDYSKLEDDPKRKWVVTVYHLTIEGSGDVADINLDFADNGDIIEV